MGKVQLVEQGKSTVETVKMPLFYMNDFSVLGLVVSKLDSAVSALRNRGYSLSSDERGATWVSFKENYSMHDLMRDLRQEGVSFTLSDLVTCAYQG